MTEAQANIQWLIKHRGYKMEEFYTIGDVQEAVGYLDMQEVEQLKKYVEEHIA